MKRVMLAMIAVTVLFSGLLVAGASQAHAMAPAHPVWSTVETADGVTYVCRTSDVNGAGTYCTDVVIHPTNRAV